MVDTYRLLVISENGFLTNYGQAGIPYLDVTPDGSASYTANFGAMDQYVVVPGGTLTTIVENVSYDVIVVSTPAGSATTFGTATSNAITLMTTGSVNEIAAANFTVYPNPANENVTFNFAGANFVNAINIMGINGSLVKNVAVNGNGQVNVNVADLAKGFYVYQIVDNDGQVVKTAKFVKQ